MGFPVMGKKYIKRALKGDDKSTEERRHNKFLSCDNFKKIYVPSPVKNKVTQLGISQWD
jgi:hypothetical protein